MESKPGPSVTLAPGETQKAAATCPVEASLGQDVFEKQLQPPKTPLTLTFSFQAGGHQHQKRLWAATAEGVPP